MVATLQSLIAWFDELQAVYADKKEYLTELDSAIGDADHGINLDRGFTAVKAALESAPPSTISEALKGVAMTLIKTVGGASGPLYGTWFLKASIATQNIDEIDAAAFVAIVDEGVAGVMARGKAEVGHKTMVDVWVPAAEAMRTSLDDGGDLATVLDAAIGAAKTGVQTTVDMVAVKGRASFLGERSRGHQDPGATSSLLMLEAARKTLPV